MLEGVEGHPDAAVADRVNLKICQPRLSIIATTRFISAASVRRARLARFAYGSSSAAVRSR